MFLAYHKNCLPLCIHPNIFTLTFAYAVSPQNVPQSFTFFFSNWSNFIFVWLITSESLFRLIQPSRYSFWSKTFCLPSCFFYVDLFTTMEHGSRPFYWCITIRTLQHVLCLRTSFGKIWRIIKAPIYDGFMELDIGCTSSKSYSLSVRSFKYNAILYTPCIWGWVSRV